MVGHGSRRGRGAHGPGHEARRHVATLHEAGVAAVSSRLALLVGGATAIAAPVDEATALFEGTLALPAAASWPFERARIQLAYGEHLRRMRAVAAARRQLTGALDCFTWLGASSWAERTGKEMRAGRRAGRTTGSVATPHLTAQEREIALLAATGLTNKQIGRQLSLSHRTVGGHLYRMRGNGESSPISWSSALGGRSHRGAWPSRRGPMHVTRVGGVATTGVPGRETRENP